MGFGYGIGNLSKTLGPLGLALIVGSSNYVNPQATVEAVFPAFLFLAFWYVLAARALWLIAPETKGHSIEEIDNALSEREPTTILAS
jgi:putative MFS transporter